MCLHCFYCLTDVTVNVLWLFLTVPWLGLQWVVVVFPDHTQILCWPSYKQIYVCLSDGQSSMSLQKDLASIIHYLTIGSTFKYLSDLRIVGACDILVYRMRHQIV